MIALTRLHHAGTALAHSVSPTAWRNSFALRPVDAIIVPALKVGVAAALVLVAGGLLGHEQLAGIAALGALTSAFSRYEPYRRLAQHLAVVAASILGATGLGAILGATGTPFWLQIVVLSLMAGLASHLFSAWKITGPGPVILVFAASAGSGFAHTVDAVPPVLLASALGGAVGWVVAMAPALVLPLGPARLAAARAIAAVLRLEEDNDRDRRAAAMLALRTAREIVALSSPPFPARERRRGLRRAAGIRRHAEGVARLLGEAEAAVALVGTDRSAAAMSRLARHEAVLRKVRRPLAAPAAAGVSAGAKPAGFLAGGRAGMASRGHAHRALRMAAGSALSGGAAVALGLEHPLWASMGAVAVLQGLNYSVTVQRGIQRVVGNVVGAGVAMALLSLSLGFWVSAALVIVFQMLAELLVLKNYTLTAFAVTPVALIMTGLGTQLGPDAALSRVADTLVGVVLGVVVAAVTISYSDRHHLPPHPDGARD